MLEKKILASNVIFLNDSHTKKDLEKYFYALEKVFKKLSEYNNVKEMRLDLVGKPSKTGFMRLN